MKIILGAHLHWTKAKIFFWPLPLLNMKSKFPRSWELLVFAISQCKWTLRVHSHLQFITLLRLWFFSMGWIVIAITIKNGHATHSWVWMNDNTEQALLRLLIFVRYFSGVLVLNPKQAEHLWSGLPLSTTISILSTSLVKLLTQQNGLIPQFQWSSLYKVPLNILRHFTDQENMAQEAN